MADVLIGLGGTGGKILKAFRQRLWTEYSESQRKKFPIGYIYVDTDSAMMNPNDVSYETIHGNCCFEPNDFVDIKQHSDVDAIFGNPKGYTRLLGILGNVNETQTAVCPVGAAADQKRRAGRILFGANIDSYLFKLASVIEDVRRKEVGGQLDIHIFAGLAGGTGSGSIVDAIAQTRKWLFEHNYNEKQFSITVFCQLPENEPKPNWDNGRYKANGYGALLELNNLFVSHYNAEWGNRVSKPCYDVSSTVDFGRLYLTYDEPTPDNVREGRIPQELKIAGGLILYSNRNDFGHTVTEPVALAGLVADFVYTRIFLPHNDQRNEFNRFYSFENIASCRDEYDETADPSLESPLPVRTKAIGSFGIKRIVVPEIALQEHIAYTLGSRSLLHLKYNNWSSVSGYRDEAINFDPLSYINNEGRRSSWMLSDEFLRLKRYILAGDSREGWPEGEFNFYWDACVDAWADVARGSEHPFDKLIELCRGGYTDGFRGRGVEHFFSEKSRSIPDAYAKQISEKVESYLFKEWADGRLPLNNVSLVVGLLKREIERTALGYTEEVLPELENKCREYEQTIVSTKEEYLHTAMLKRLVVFGNRYERAIHFSKLLYREKTEVAAVRLFAQPLAQALERNFDSLEKRVISFIQRVDNLIQFTKERMVALADLHTAAADEEMDGTENMTLPIIQFYNRNKMLQLESRLQIDKDKMDSINAIVRNAIVAALQTDGRFTNALKLDSKVISKAFLGPVYENIKIFHDNLCTERQDKVLGESILQRLAQKYSGNDMALSNFAEQIIKASGVFTEINMNEIRLNNENTPPPTIGQNILLKRILVSLPRTDDPDLVSFASTLETKLKNAIPGGAGASVTVSTEGTNNNEISVVILENAYPMRAISSVPMLKAEYDRLIIQDPKNRIVLLSEGKEGDFRNLFARPPMKPEQVREEYAPYLIMDLGLKCIQKDTVRTGEYGVVETDILGGITINPWGKQKFSDIPYDDRLLNEKRTAIMKLYAEGLEEAFNGIDCTVVSLVNNKKEELKKLMLTTIGSVIKEENLERSRYNDFLRWVESAVKILMAYMPQIK